MSFAGLFVFLLLMQNKVNTKSIFVKFILHYCECRSYYCQTV